MTMKTLAELDAVLVGRFLITSNVKSGVALEESKQKECSYLIGRKWFSSRRAKVSRQSHEHVT